MRSQSLALLIALLLLGSVQAQLSPEILVDRYLLQAEERQARGNYYGALESLQKVLNLQKEHGISLPDEFHFQHAQAAFSAGEVQAALGAVTKYLTLSGRTGEHYRAALRLLDSAEEKLQEIESERRRNEAERRRLEAERKRKEALQKENAEQAKRQIESASIRLARDPMRSGGFGPEMVTVQKGRFQYELTWGVGDGRSKRINPWKSFDKPFAISKYETTLGEFKRFIKSTRHRPDSERRGCSGSRREPEKGSWKRLYFDQNDRHPVVCVNRRDAIAYVRWLSRETGQSYRLPTVVEWEYAARAGSQWSMLELESDTVRFRKGGYNLLQLLEHWESQGWTNHCGRANLRESKHENCSDGVKNTAPVGSFPPNSIGLHDMIGNVEDLVSNCFEFKEDWHPEKGSHDIENCKYDVSRGAGFMRSFGINVRYNEWDVIGGDYDNRYGRNSADVGFRVVKDLPTDPASR